MISSLGRILTGLTNWALGCLLFTVGLLGIALSWSTRLQAAIIHLITERTLLVSLFCLGLVFMGLSIMVYAILHTKRRCISIRMGARAISIDETLVEQYLDTYWRDTFPQSHIPFQVTVKPDAIHIIADLPALQIHEQQQFLLRIQHDFDELFGKTLGYLHEIHLTASFQEDEVKYPVSTAPLPEAI